MSMIILPVIPPESIADSSELIPLAKRVYKKNGEIIKTEIIEITPTQHKALISDANTKG